MTGVPIKHFFTHIRFEKAVKHRNRFFLNPALLDYANSVVELAKDRFTNDMKQGDPVYRARLHSANSTDDRIPYVHEYKPTPYPASEMGAPPTGLAADGRLNPAGIRYLYSASDKLTAIAEIRPWVGAYLSVGTMTLNRDVKLIDARMRNDPATPGENQDSANEDFLNLWHHVICWSFSLPHHPGDNTAYAPTQFFSSAFQNAGLDGIIYSSSLNWGGFNIAFFDPNVTTADSVELNRVESINYTTKT